jgi:hypothetical protein
MSLFAKTAPTRATLPNAAFQPLASATGCLNAATPLLLAAVAKISGGHNV